MARKKFEPNKETCTVQIRVHHETEKAYAVYAGNNGRITRNREWYEFVAKSICYVDENGNVFAPSWATRGIPFSEIIRY